MLFLFDNYTLDTDRRELHCGAAAIAVEPQVFDLLAYLIENCERVVSKDDLIAAVWRGRAISDSTLTTRLNAARRAIGDSGEKQHLIRTLPRKGVRFVGAVRKQRKDAAVLAQRATTERPEVPLSLPDKPSVAVLPFTNMSGDPEQEYFSDGVVEEIITALSRFSSLFVIARNSSFTYKGRAVDVKVVRRQLGVRYVLEGSVRKAGNLVRITGQLVDAESGAHMWADRFDGPVEDIFDLQDRVTANVFTAIVPKLEQAEIRRVMRKPTEDLNAYDYFLRAMARYNQYSKNANSEALQLFSRAFELDPGFATAYGLAARCYGYRSVNRWMTDAPREKAEAVRLARRAIEMAGNDAVALCTAGSVLDSIGREPHAAAVFIQRACALNPNLASAWLFSGSVRTHLGDPELAIADFERALRLSPLDQMMFLMHTGMAFAHFLADRPEEGAVWAERALCEKPDWLPALRIATMSYALAGQCDGARHAMSRLLNLDPSFCISKVKDLALFVRAEDRARLEHGFRIAGLPE